MSSKRQLTREEYLANSPSKRHRYHEELAQGITWSEANGPQERVFPVETGSVKTSRLHVYLQNTRNPQDLQIPQNQIPWLQNPPQRELSHLEQFKRTYSNQKRAQACREMQNPAVHLLNNQMEARRLQNLQKTSQKLQRQRHLDPNDSPHPPARLPTHLNSSPEKSENQKRMEAMARLLEPPQQHEELENEVQKSKNPRKSSQKKDIDLEKIIDQKIDFPMKHVELQEPDLEVERLQDPLEPTQRLQEQPETIQNPLQEALRLQNLVELNQRLLEQPTKLQMFLERRLQSGARLEPSQSLELSQNAVQNSHNQTGRLLNSMEPSQRHLDSQNLQRHLGNLQNPMELSERLHEQIQIDETPQEMAPRLQNPVDPSNPFQMTPEEIEKLQAELDFGEGLLEKSEDYQCPMKDYFEPEAHLEHQEVTSEIQNPQSLVEQPPDLQKPQEMTSRFQNPRRLQRKTHPDPICLKTLEFIIICLEHPEPLTENFKEGLPGLVRDARYRLKHPEYFPEDDQKTKEMLQKLLKRSHCHLEKIRKSRKLQMIQKPKNLTSEGEEYLAAVQRRLERLEMPPRHLEKPQMPPRRHQPEVVELEPSQRHLEQQHQFKIEKSKKKMTSRFQNRSQRLLERPEALQNQPTTSRHLEPRRQAQDPQNQGLLILPPRQETLQNPRHQVPKIRISPRLQIQLMSQTVPRLQKNLEPRYQPLIQNPPRYLKPAQNVPQRLQNLPEPRHQLQNSMKTFQNSARLQEDLTPLQQLHNPNRYPVIMPRFVNPPRQTEGLLEPPPRHLTQGQYQIPRLQANLNHQLQNPPRLQTTRVQHQTPLEPSKKPAILNRRLPNRERLQTEPSRHLNQVENQNPRRHQNLEPHHQPQNLMSQNPPRHQEILLEPTHQLYEGQIYQEYQLPNDNQSALENQDDYEILGEFLKF